MEITNCPQINAETDERCNMPAEIIDRYALESTDGPIEHVSTRCLGRHVLKNFPAEKLA